MIVEFSIFTVDRKVFREKIVNVLTTLHLLPQWEHKMTEPNTNGGGKSFVLMGVDHWSSGL